MNEHKSKPNEYTGIWNNIKFCNVVTLKQPNRNANNPKK